MDETERKSRNRVRRALRRNRRKALVGALAVLVVTALTGAALLSLVGRSHRESIRRSVTDLVHTEVHTLDQQLTRSMSTAGVVASMLELDAEQTTDQFDRIARDLLAEDPTLDALALAPDGVHTQVAPEGPYGSVIGFDLFDDPQRRAEAEAQIAERTLRVAGPLPVVGSEATGFFGRVPVFRPPDSDDFWGFVVAVVEVPTLLEQSGIDELEQEGYAYRLATPDPAVEPLAATGTDRLVDPVSAPIVLAGETWTLEIAPFEGWGGSAHPLHVAGLAVAALILAAATYRLLRQPDLLREQVRARTVALETTLDEARQGKRRLAAVTEHLEGVLQSSPDAVVAGDAEGIVTEWNAAAERLYGWSREEMVGRHVSTLVPPGEPAAIDQATTQEGPSGATRTVVPRLRRDGTVFQAELTLSVFRDEEGRVRTWVSVVRDVTHELLVSRAQDAVRAVLQPTAAVRALVEVLEEVCPAEVMSLVELSGSTGKRHACISRSGEVLAPPEHLAVTESIVGRAAHADGPVLDEGLRPDRAIGHAWVSWRVAIPLRRSDEVVAVLVLGGDGDTPTGRALELLGRVGAAIAQDAVNVLLYERQRETTERLYEVDQLKSDFLSAVSHELRTPLTAIAGFASTLEERWEDLHPTMRQNFVRRIVGRSKALDDLVRELLDYSRLENRPVEVEPVPCELAREVRREVDDLDHVLGGHRVEVEVPGDLLVEADPAALSRIIQNLLTNAAKFSPPASRIRVEAARSTGHVVVRVSDEGIGISPEEHERIFQRFYRVNRGDRVQAGGTGIGLALVKEYVEALGGRVWVESEPGHGSTFVVTLRRIEVAARPADEREQASG